MMRVRKNELVKIGRSIPVFIKEVTQHMANLNCHQSWTTLTSGYIASSEIGSFST